MVTAFTSSATRGSQRDVVYLGRPIAPSYISPNAGEGGSCVAWSQQMSMAVHRSQINFGDRGFKEMSTFLADQ